MLSAPYAASSGTPTLEGAQLAAEHANAAGGALVAGRRRRVELVVRDHPDRPDGAAASARALINQEAVVALVGPQFSRHAIAVATIAENAAVPMISPMSTNPRTTAGKQYVFRLAFLDDVQGRVLGRFAARDLGAARAAVLYDVSSAYSRTLAELFRDAFEDTGGSVVAFETFTRDEPRDYRDRLRRIAAGRPDVLLLPNFIDHVQPQIRQARELGIGAVVLGGDGWDLPPLLAMPEAEGSFMTHHWRTDVPAPETAAFINAYRARFGETPRTTAAMTYDAVRLLIAAIEQGSADPDDIRTAIRSTRHMRGATGVMDFAGTNDPGRSTVISRLTRGEVVFHSIHHPDSRTAPPR